jgi:hypothetical protein
VLVAGLEPDELADRRVADQCAKGGQDSSLDRRIEALQIALRREE